MDLHVFLAVLAAAAMHAGWNAGLKLRIDPFLAMNLIVATCGFIGLALVAWFGWPRSESWPYLFGSVVLHLGYYWGLTEAYRRADMGQIYPLARGSAPLMTALLSIFILGESISRLGFAGVALLGLGVLLMAWRGGAGGSPDRKALGYAFFTAVTISGYSICDGMGARVSGDPHAYSAALFVVDGVFWSAFAYGRAGSAAFAPLRTHFWPGMGGGALSVGAYWVAIWAMTKAPIPLVAALRETSVLFGAAISVTILGEKLSAGRIAAVMLSLAGVAAIRLG